MERNKFAGIADGLTSAKQIFKIALITIFIFSRCTTDNTKEVAGIMARSKALTISEEQMNIPEIMKYWAKDAIVQPEGMPQIRGKENIIKLYHRIYEDTALKLKSFTSSSINSPNLTVAKSGDVAYDYGTNHFVFFGNNGDFSRDGKYLVVWKKIDGDWFVSALSFTNDSASPVYLAGKCFVR